MFLINGCEQNMLLASDRATQFGDGCFTTACIIDGEISLFAAHLERLQDACQKLLISFENWSELQNEMKMLAKGHVRGVLKVIISRGSGGRGYSGKVVTAPHASSPFQPGPFITIVGGKMALCWR